MIVEELQRKIADFRELGLPALIPRDGNLHQADRMVSTVIGARRAGKSFRVMQLAGELIAAGRIPSLRHVCALDFDNPILAGAGTDQLPLIQETFLKMTPEADLKTPLLFILDEVHRLPGWEEYVIDLSRNPHWKVVVTGSSSKLLREEMATGLRGKALSTILYPLSFAEFLKFRGVDIETRSTRDRAAVRRAFDQYLTWGGYPGVVLADERSREALLREYFDTMILRDIIERHNPGKPAHAIDLYGYLLSNIARPHTLQSAYAYLKQKGHASSRDAVRDYLAWAGDAWLVFPVPIMAAGHKEEERNYKKIYCIDWALAIRNSSVWDGSWSRAFENMVYLHLTRRYPRVRYYLTRTKRQEVDFIAVGTDDKPDMAVQVCQDIGDVHTLRREVEPLVAAARWFKTKRNFIVTLNQERRLEENGVTVHALPAWKWFLETL